jgi:hypothetical protein
MSAIYEHPSYAGRIGPQPSRQVPNALVIESKPEAGLTSLASAERACCCIAKPAVVAFMPTAPGQQTQTDLLLCMHHYRASRQKLSAAGARVVDASGALLTERDLW